MTIDLDAIKQDTKEAGGKMNPFSQSVITKNTGTGNRSCMRVGSV